MSCKECARKSGMIVEIGAITTAVKQENEQLRAENAVLVEALQKLINSVACRMNYDDDTMQTYSSIGRKALANTSEQAKALLAVVEAACDPLNHATYEVFPHKSDESDEDCVLCRVVAAYDKLREGK